MGQSKSPSTIKGKTAILVDTLSPTNITRNLALLKFSFIDTFVATLTEETSLHNTHTILNQATNSHHSCFTQSTALKLSSQKPGKGGFQGGTGWL